MVDPVLMARAKSPIVHFGRGVLSWAVEAFGGGHVLVTQAEVIDLLPPSARDSALHTVLVESLEEDVLRRQLEALGSVQRVVGVGGGMAMDTAKYFAWRTGRPLLLAPSVISVDASVANTIALRRHGRVEYDGFVVAEPIVVDLDIVDAAPPHLNRAGVGDLLSIHTARVDWRLGSKATDVPFDPEVDQAAAQILERLYGLSGGVAHVTDGALETIFRSYVEVNALLLSAGHSGPEEGSEHYFAYAVEAATGRSFVHGQLVSLGVVVMATVQDNEPDRARRFLDASSVAWRPEELGLDLSTLTRVLVELPDFVRRAGLPHSIIDETDLADPQARMYLDMALAVPVGERPQERREEPR
jgi:glycerol-1-phosphate dehydrogenase [NAD(P)+]